MTSLGSVFEPEGSGPRGRDLQFLVRVHPSQLEQAGSLWIPVPVWLRIGSEQVARTVRADDPEETIVVALPASSPETFRLRLRGYGEPLPDGRSGDLLLTIRSDEDAEPLPWMAAPPANPDAPPALRRQAPSSEGASALRIVGYVAGAGLLWWMLLVLGGF